MSSEENSSVSMQNFLNLSKSLERKHDSSLYRYIDVRWEDGKKIPVSGDHSNYSVDEIRNDRGNKSHNWLSLSLKHIPDFYCIDFDNYDGQAINSYSDQSFLTTCELYRKLDTSGCYKSKTKKGYHFYVYIRNLGKYKHQQKIGKVEGYEIDLLKTNNIWSPKHRKVTGEEVEYNWCDLECYFNQSKMNFINQPSAVPSVQVPSEVHVPSEVPVRSDSDKISSDPILERICDLINVDYLDDRDSWIRIVWGLKNGSESNKELARYLSQKSKKYEEKYFEKLWKDGKEGTSLGTVFHYAHISNPSEYLYLMGKRQYKESNLENWYTDDGLACEFLSLMEGNYVLKNDTLYVYNVKSGYWSKDTKGNNRLKYYVGNVLSSYFGKLVESKRKEISSSRSATEEEKLKKELGGLLAVRKRMKSTTHIGQCTTRIIHHLSVKDFSDVEFDNDPMLFAFRNCCYNLKKCEWHQVSREDYILTTTGYNYEKPSEDSREKLLEVLVQIFPDEEVLRCYTSILATGLVGLVIEKLVVANGSGGNGKSLLNELMLSLLGNYGYTAPNSVLINEMKTGSNPEIANMNRRRLIVYKEPDASSRSQINLSVVKELTGGAEINARMNYANDCKTLLNATHIVECNEKPKLSGRMDEAVVRRLVDIPFVSTFTEREEMYTNPDLSHTYKADPYYKTDEYKVKTRCVLFEYLCDWIKTDALFGKKLSIPSVVNERTQRYIESSDEIKVWFDSVIEKSDEKYASIKLDDLYKRFGESSLWVNYSKKERRTWTREYFIESIRENVNFKMYYKMTGSKKWAEYHGQSSIVRNILVGFRLKDQE